MTSAATLPALSALFSLTGRVALRPGHRHRTGRGRRGRRAVQPARGAAARAPGGSVNRGDPGLRRVLTRAYVQALMLLASAAA